MADFFLLLFCKRFNLSFLRRTFVYKFMQIFIFINKNILHIIFIVYFNVYEIFTTYKIILSLFKILLLVYIYMYYLSKIIIIFIDCRVYQDKLAGIQKLLCQLRDGTHVEYVKQLKKLENIKKNQYENSFFYLLFILDD